MKWEKGAKGTCSVKHWLKGHETKPRQTRASNQQLFKLSTMSGGKASGMQSKDKAAKKPADEDTAARIHVYKFKEPRKALLLCLSLDEHVSYGKEDFDDGNTRLRLPRRMSRYSVI